MNEIGVLSFTIMCWISMADFTLLGGLTKAKLGLHVKTEFCLGLLKAWLGEGAVEYKASVRQLTLYFEKDILCYEKEENCCIVH